ncbi:MAG TPA: hypothetical protein VHL80_10530 [Polyangia bacterium]|nr:hypothetical protein [Polyangia bacterium]
MARAQHQSSTFIVPEPAPGVTVAGPSKAKRDAAPFVIVPESMVIVDDELEPHWLPAIELATD